MGHPGPCRIRGRPGGSFSVARRVDAARAAGALRCHPELGAQRALVGSVARGARGAAGPGPCSRRAPPSPERPPRTAVATRGARWHAGPRALHSADVGCTLSAPGCLLAGAPPGGALAALWWGKHCCGDRRGSGHAPRFGPRETDAVAAVARLAAPRRRQRRQGRPSTEPALPQEQRATPPPAAPTRSAACDPLVAMWEADLVAELRRRVLLLVRRGVPPAASLCQFVRGRRCRAQSDATVPCCKEGNALF